MAAQSSLANVNQSDASRRLAASTKYLGLAHNHTDFDLHHKYRCGLMRPLRLEDIEPRPELNPRAALGDMKWLTESIAEEGLESPLVVRPGPGCYELVCGLRRYRILRSLEFAEPIPCIVRNDLMGEDGRSIAVALADNVDSAYHGSTLNTIEIGRALKKLCDLGWEPWMICEETRTSISMIHKALALVEAPADVQKKVIAGLNPSAALEYSRLDKKTRAAVSKSITKYTTVRDVRELLSKAQRMKSTPQLKGGLVVPPTNPTTAWKRAADKQYLLRQLCAKLLSARTIMVGTRYCLELEGTIAALLWDRGDRDKPWAPAIMPSRKVKGSKALAVDRASFDALVKREAAKYKP